MKYLQLDLDKSYFCSAIRLNFTCLLTSLSGICEVKNQPQL